MIEIKLTKNEMRIQQQRFTQLNRYLPTLQLKKALLQSEVVLARQEMEWLEQEYLRELASSEEFAGLLTAFLPVDLFSLTQIQEIEKELENIAGVEIAKLRTIQFKEVEYSLLDSPPWLDSLVAKMRSLVVIKTKRLVAEEKKNALEKELRQVSIRVNLFEKILIPRAEKNIQKIKVFLSDQELAAVSRAKVAKAKIIRSLG